MATKYINTSDNLGYLYFREPEKIYISGDIYYDPSSVKE